MSEAVQMQYIPLDDLEYEGVRDIRPNVVSELKDRIEANGFNPSRPLHVVRENGHFIVADGNHRLKSLDELGHDSPVPCVIEDEGTDIHSLAVQSNRDENTYAPEDLFDALDRIDDLRDDGHTQKEIAEILSDGQEEWSRSKVKDHARILSNVGEEVLDLARSHQKGRSPTDGENSPTFNFSKGWFKSSGIYDLDSPDSDDESDSQAEIDVSDIELSDIPEPEDENATEDETDHDEEPFDPQQKFIEWFVDEKGCEAGKQNIEHKTDELDAIQTQLSLLETELNEGVSDDTADELREAVRRNEYSTDSLEDAIEAANEGAKDRTYFGEDAVEQLAEFEDNQFACVVTDMPYGVGYEAQYDVGRPDFGIEESDALDLLYDVLQECKRVCKANAHLYVFFPTKLYTQVRTVAEEFFEVEPVPLVWLKNNIATTRKAPSVGFKQMYAQKYETLFHLRGDKGDSRELNGDSSPNVLEYDIPKGKDNRWHNSQKPIGLWEEVITNSTGPGETILDPFAGSGSALLAAKKTGRHYVGIEQDDDYESRFKKELREIEGGDSDE